MVQDEPPLCEHCGSATDFSGRTSAPPFMIYKCVGCGRHQWRNEESQQQHGQQPPKE